MPTARPIVALLLLTAAGPATKPATRPTAAFVSDYGFRLKYPADWIVPAHPDEGQMFTVYLPLDRPATRPVAGKLKGVQVGGLGLRIEQGPSGVPDKNIVRDLSGTMAANLFADLDLAAKHVAVRPATVGDLPARQVRFEVAPNGGPAVTVVYVIAVRKGTEYVFNAAVPSAKFDALWPDMAAVLASFDVRN